MGNDIRGAAGEKIIGTTDALYGAPISLNTARYVLALALLNGWGVDAGDVDGAYLRAELGGAPVITRLHAELWAAAGADADKLASMRDPCVRVKKAMYGLPRAGFDWFAYADELLVNQLGWSRHCGVDSVYHK